jgi:hypothetical protein
MDLLKLIDGLRAYRAQVEEAIAAMEELARRRGLTARERRRLEKEAAQGSTKNARKPRGKNTRLRPKLVKPKRGRPVRKGKSG